MVRWPFTANRVQVATYLLGVALFSISFLVFLNSSVSFVVTNLIGQKEHVGDAVGSLGFADELLALFACPFWGILSDRIGVRAVCTLGYTLVGVSLFVFVQAQNVYPQLLLARLFFSLGGAATATMVTAILPAMTADRGVPTIRITPDHTAPASPPRGARHRPTDSASSATTEATLTPGSWPREPSRDDRDRAATTTSRTAGLVGMFTGLGALVALGVFFPLPAMFEKSGQTPAAAVKSSFYVVGAVALAVAIFCSIGLRWLPGEESKGWRNLVGKLKDSEYREASATIKGRVLSFARLFRESVALALTDPAIGLGCLGGFVARASSVGISLFVPLFVNAYFISAGLCADDPHSPPAEIKKRCRQAYTLAFALTGASQLVALLAAPLIGYLDGRFKRSNGPLIVGAACGVVGYTLLGNTDAPDPKRAGGSIFLVMALIGVSQISSIVCSLSILGRGLQTRAIKSSLPSADDAAEGASDEQAQLLPSNQRQAAKFVSRTRIKGSVAGLYSLCGGAGILLLTKLGGYLFDRWSSGAPFYIMAVYNAVLLVVALVVTLLTLRGTTT